MHHVVHGLARQCYEPRRVHGIQADENVMVLNRPAAAEYASRQRRMGFARRAGGAFDFEVSRLRMVPSELWTGYTREMEGREGGETREVGLMRPRVGTCRWRDRAIFAHGYACG